jgi:hypothetical protein
MLVKKSTSTIFTLTSLFFYLPPLIYDLPKHELFFMVLLCLGLYSAHERKHVTLDLLCGEQIMKSL